MEDVVIFTDGSCDKEKIGGWASLVIGAHSSYIISGHVLDTTNNRMEITAALEAIKTIEIPSNIYLVSDSAYLLNTIKNKWYEEWFAYNNRLNLDLWIELIEVIKIHNVNPVKVKGHQRGENRVEYNQLVDEIAGSCRKGRLSTVIQEFRQGMKIGDVMMERNNNG